MNPEHTPDDSQQVKVPQFTEEIHEQVQEKGSEINLSKTVHDDINLCPEPQEIQQDNIIKEISIDKDQEVKAPEPQEAVQPEVQKPSPTEATLIPIRSPRKRIFYIGAFIAVVIVSLTLGLYFGLKRKDEPEPRITFMESLKDPNQPFFIRQWNEGAQEIYYVNMAYDMEMGAAEAPEQKTSQALYMFSTTTVKVLENKTLINAFVMPISADFKFDPNKIKNVNSITETSAKEDQNNLVWCWILNTGLIESCKKPTYLDRSNYELTLSFIDQYSPRLEKSYYNNPERRQRRLQEQTEPVMGFDDINESRDYTFDVDEDEGEVTLGNNYENENFSYSDQKTNDKSSMSTQSSAKVDGATGRITSSLNGGSFSCEADKTKGQTLLEVFKSNVKSTMDLKTYHLSADARYLKFLDKMHDVIEFMEILNPMTNRTVLDAELSEDEKPTIDPEEPEEEDEGEDGTRRLQYGRRSIIKIDEAIFETSLIGLPVNARIQANCYDDDQCDIKLKARLLFVSVTVTAITVPFEAASIANTYRFIKLKVIDNVNNAMVLVTDTVNILDKTILGSITEVENYAKTILRPFNSAKSKFQNIMDTFNKKIVEMGTFIPEMTGFIKVQQNEIVSSLEDRFNSLVIDLDLIVAKMDRTFTRIETIASTFELDAEIKDQVSSYLASTIQNLDSFYKEKNAELLQTKKGFEAIVDRVNTKIDNIHINPQILAKFPEAASLLKIAQMFKGYFTTISGTFLKSMNNFYDNFIIRYGAQFERLQKGLLSTQKSVQNQLQVAGTLPAMTAELKKEITKLMNSSDLKTLLLDQIYLYDVDLAQYEQDIAAIIQKGVEKFYLGIKTTLENGSKFFTDLYQEIKNDVEATSSELLNHNFADLVSRITANVQADFNKLKTDFNTFLDSTSGLTNNNYKPSIDTIKAERKSLDLVNAVKEIVTTFNNLKNVVQSFDKIKNFNLNAFNPLKDVPNNIISTITEIKSTYTKAVGTIQKMAEEFQMSFPAPNVNFDILQVTFQGLPGRFKDNLFQTLTAQVINKAKDTGYLQNMLSFQGILDGKLASLIPKIEGLLANIDAFRMSKGTPKISIPTPIGAICFDGQFGLALGVKITYGFGNGEMYFSVAPYGSADLGIYAYLDWGIIQAGGYVKGIFFDGRLPATVAFAFLGKLELRASLQLYLKPFAIEAGAAIRFITIDIHFCCSISFDMGDWIILGAIRTESDPIIINIWEKKLALK